MIAVTIEGMSPAFSQVVLQNLNQRDMAKQLPTPLRLTIARVNFALKNYSCELFNLTGTIEKVELISTLQQPFAKAGM